MRFLTFHCPLLGLFRSDLYHELFSREDSHRFHCPLLGLFRSD